MVSDSEIDSFLRESVIKKDGGLDKTQFYSIFQPIMQNLKNGMQRMAIKKFKELCIQERNQMLKLFQSEDFSKGGKIDKQGLQNVLQNVNFRISQAEFDSLWGEL